MGTSIFDKLKEREVYKTFIIYVASSWGILEAVDFFSNRFAWPDLLFNITLAVLVSGLPFSIIRAWFHGIPGSQRISRHEIFLIVLNVFFALFLITFAIKDSGSVTSSTKINRDETDRSIAVLPFINMSNDPDQEYFSDGVAEDILNHLVKISTLKVKSRTSTWKYKNAERDVQKIGQELGVSSILEGSIRKAGNIVRIVVQLVDVNTDEQLWSETYDREIKDILRLQTEIAIEVVKSLNTILTQFEKNSISDQASTDITAYDYFLRARQIINQSNDIRRDYDNALSLLNRAISLDPKFAAAYALKAYVWRWLGTYGIDYHTWVDSALYYSTKAIELNPSLPDGYLIRSTVYNFLNKPKQYKQDLYKAFEVSPNEPNVLENLGYELLYNYDARGADMILESLEARYSKKDPEYYWILGWLHYSVEDYTTAEQLLEKGRSLDPGSIEPYWRLAFLYRALKKYPESLRASEQAIAINPTNPTMIDNMAWAYFLNGDLENAKKYWSKYSEIESTFEDSTQHVPFRHRLGYVLWLQGKQKEGLQLINKEVALEVRVIEGKAGIGVWPTVAKASNFYDLAACKAFLGKKQEALTYLDSAIVNGLDFPWGLRYDPLFSAVRSDSAYTSIVEKAFARKRFFSMAVRKTLNIKS